MRGFSGSNGFRLPHHQFDGALFVGMPICTVSYRVSLRPPAHWQFYFLNVIKLHCRNKIKTKHENVTRCYTACVHLYSRTQTRRLERSRWIHFCDVRSLNIQHPVHPHCLFNHNSRKNRKMRTYTHTHSAGLTHSKVHGTKFFTPFWTFTCVNHRIIWYH